MISVKKRIGYNVHLSASSLIGRTDVAMEIVGYIQFDLCVEIWMMIEDNIFRIFNEAG